jgi:tetratricopeptide (TPR) repeat protein
MESRLTLAALAIVLAAYVFLGGMGLTDAGNPSARDANYNLLARGLLSGQLNLDKAAPEGLTRLADPYDPAANAPFRRLTGDRLQDISFYRGKLYLYFGAAPAILLFIPWHLLTTSWMQHWAAVVVLCAGGLLTYLSLFRSVLRQAFPLSPPWMTAFAVLVLGFGSYAPLLLARADMWEIPIAFSSFAVAVALRSLWEAIGNPRRSAAWLALASAAFGAAFAARPTVLPNAAVLLVPFALREVRRSPWAWAAAVVPLGLCGAGVALYNELRFGSAFEFGQHYQLAGQYVAKLKLFSPGYLPTNLRLYLFQGVQWSAVFPFAHEPPDGALPADHGKIEHISGVLLNAPILWAGLAAPFLAGAARGGRRFALIAAAAAWIAASSLGLMALFFGTCSRYQSEFTPCLALLAAFGILGIGAIGHGWVRNAAAAAAACALVFSCLFTVLYAVDRAVVDHTNFGRELLLEGNYAGADKELGAAQFLSPGYSIARLERGLLLYVSRRPEEARLEFAGLVRDYPGYAAAHLDLATVLGAEGKFTEAAGEYRQALRLEPENERAKAGLDAALAHLK